MKYGKIRIEDGFLVFTRHMMINNLPCKDIVWAYMRKEGADEGDDRQLSVNYLVIVTRRKKRYKFDMTEKEIHECIRILKILNPDMATGFPKGGRISLHSLPNTRDLGAIVTADDRHILPRRLLRSGELYHISESDKNRLREGYNLRTVIDLRSAEERKCKPDTIIAEVEYYHVPVVDEDVQVISNREQFVKMLAGLPDGRIYDQTVQEFMHGSAGVETVCEVYRYSFQAGKRCCFVALRNWKGPYRNRDCFFAQSAGGGGRCDI